MGYNDKNSCEGRIYEKSLGQESSRGCGNAIAGRPALPSWMSGRNAAPEKFQF